MFYATAAMAALEGGFQTAFSYNENLESNFYVNMARIPAMIAAMIAALTAQEQVLLTDITIKVA